MYRLIIMTENVMVDIPNWWWTNNEIPVPNNKEKAEHVAVINWLVDAPWIADVLLDRLCDTNVQLYRVVLLDPQF